MTQTPFDNVEAAHEYARLLVEAVQQARAEVAQDVAVAAADPGARQLEALRVVLYKLERLEAQLASSRRLLNDLRRLLRLLLGEAETIAKAARTTTSPGKTPDGVARESVASSIAGNIQHMF